MTNQEILEEWADKSKEDKERYIKANGWYQLWHPDNWVPKNATNPDTEGHSLDQAFCATIRKAGVTRNGH
jgi:hypothetical protein